MPFAAPMDIEILALGGLSFKPTNEADQDIHLPLTTWLNRNSCAFDILHHLHVARAIAIAVRDYHDAGTSLQPNKMCTSNIFILDLADSGHQHCIIRLPPGACGGDTNTAAKNDTVEDLKDLGLVVSELFQAHIGANIHPSQSGGSETEIVRWVTDEDEDEQPRRRKKRVNRRGSDVDGLPLYLSSMISALSGGRYTNVKDVLSDLNAAITKHDIYFRQLSTNATFMELKGNLPNYYYGQQSALLVLMHSFHTVMTPGNQQSMMVAVTGAGGMGKTTLVNQLLKPLKEKHGYLISGKFDLVAGRDSIIFSAFDSFFETLLEEGGNDTKLMRLRKRINEVVGGFGVNVLAKSIPSLDKLVGDTFTKVQYNDHQGTVLQTRWQVLLCKLISAIADETNPIVLVLDDLQWADETSLELLEIIATDPDIKYCLCIGCYRDDDLCLTKDVANMFNGIKNHTSVMEINLGPLEKESVNNIISETFCFPPSLAEQLALVVFNKTAGAPMYVVNFLQSLCEEGLIRFNLTDRRWEYQIKGILLKELPEGVVQYLTSQMEKLPQSYRLVLKVAACLGHSFDYAIFQKAKVTTMINLEDLLPRVTSLGYIQESGTNHYTWVHDQIHQAALGLIPLESREAFHLLIGTKLLMNSPVAELEKSIFDIVALFSFGKRLLESDEQIYEVVDLILLAGETALSTSSFSSAAAYFLSGIDLLRDDCWDTRYNLSLKLHNAALEVLYAIGDFTTLRLLASEVLSFARNFDDKLTCYHHLVRCLVSARQSEEGLKTCILVLGELGETEGIAVGLGFTMNLSMYNILSGSLPTQLMDVIAWGHYKSTKMLLSKYSEEDILCLPRMVHERKLMAMEFLSLMVSSTNSGRPHLLAVVVCRMVKLTLEYGLCDSSACAFSAFGNMNVLIDQDFDKGHRYGQFACALLKRQNERNIYLARVFTHVYGFINVWKNPFQASLPKLLEGYDAGCIDGDMEYSYWQIQIYCALSLNSGEDLVKLQETAMKHAQRAMQHKQLTVANGIVTMLSAICELTCDASTRDVAYQAVLNCTEDTLYQQLTLSNEHRACVLICNKGKLVSILKGDIESAVKYYQASLNHPCGVTTSINLIMATFTDGLLAFICAQRHRRNEQDPLPSESVGLKAIKTMKHWVISSQWNFESKLFLLEAEAMILKGDHESSKEKYEASIKAARRSRFVHEEGFAFDRFGHFYLGRGREADAILQFNGAKKCYEKWGAVALVRHIEDKIDCLERSGLRRLAEQN
ncbi:hypothetical protein ACHAXR_008044 [Thalassiosira sp. AJA248-18]